MSFYEFFQGCGIKGPDKLRGIVLVAQHAGWWWPFEGAVVLTDRPELLRRDDQGELHCEDGPALLYRDGWGVWAWHGVRVPRVVVEEPQRLEARLILGESNLEVRRVMIERFGAERLIRDSNATLLDHIHEPPFDGLLDAKLWRVELRQDEPLVMLECQDSTPMPGGERRRYMLRVPPDMERAHNAVAWTFEEEADSYAPAVET